MTLSPLEKDSYTLFDQVTNKNFLVFISMLLFGFQLLELTKGTEDTVWWQDKGKYKYYVKVIMELKKGGTGKGVR